MPISHQSMHEGHNADNDHMRGTGRSHDLFETEFINRYDGWSVPFQSFHDESKDSRVDMCGEVISD